MRALLFFLVFILAGAFPLAAQNTIAFQGFETPPNCPDWSYSGGVVNTETARTGTRSARVGRMFESPMLTFAPQTVTGYANVVLSLYHAVRGGSGPGMDTDEGAQIEVQLNGGAWTMIGRVTGWGDYNWTWSSVGGNPGSGCIYTCANGLFYNVPAGTNTVAVRMFSQTGASCPKALGNYNRADEGFFIDDVLLTTTSTVITPGSGTVVWTGAVDTDWFKCQNWNPQIVPGPAWDVIIDQTSVNNCVIGVNASTPLSAFANALIVQSNSATNRTLTISNARSLAVTGLVTVQRTVSTGQLGITVQSGTFTSGGLTLTGTGTGLLQALFRNIVSTNTVQINGHVNINFGGILDLQGAPGGTLRVTGDLNNNDVATAFPKVGSQVILNGTGAQEMYSETATGEPYASLRVTKPGGDVTLNAPISVSGTLDLVQGRVFSTALNLVHLQSTSVVTNVSNASFVSGPVRKRGNTNFTFPVGKGVYYRPITITSPGGNAALYFTAEYFVGDPVVAFGVPLDPTLDHVSNCEWWILDRSAAQTPLVTLSWDVTSCGVTYLPDLRVAEWYSGQWRDRGNGGTTGNTVAGTVITSAPQLQFSAPTPWTLASITSENPLPIELVSFTAVPEGQQVLAQWITATERNNAWFDVERSVDGFNFERIGRLPGAGNSNSTLWYELVDAEPLKGLSYYRLRQIDDDGTSTVSAMVPVYFDVNAEGDMVVYTDADGLHVLNGLAVGSSYELYDASGKLLTNGVVTEAGRANIDAPSLANGVYLLRMTNGSQERTARFAH